MKENNGKIGLLDTVMILVGGMIGSAIFSLSGLTISGAGPSAIISWIIGGAILLCYGLQCAELGTIFPTSGGIYTFPEKTLGKTERGSRALGFLSMWTYIFGCIGGGAFSCTYVATYLGVGFPFFADKVVLVAIIAAILCGVANIVNFAITGKANTALTVLLLVTLVTFIVAAFTSGQWDASNFTPFFTQGSDGSRGFLTQVPTAMLAYGSIVAAAFMVGEIKDAEKTMPKAMLIAIIVVISFYLLVLISTIGLVTAAYLHENPGMTYIPLYAAAFTKLYTIPWITKLISISATLALITTILVGLGLAVRGVAAAAEDGTFPKLLAKRNKQGVAFVSVILVTAVIAVICAFPAITNIVVNFGALCNATSVVLISLSFIKSRTKFAGKATFKAPFGKVVSIIVVAILVFVYLQGALSNATLWIVTGVYILIGAAIFAIAESKRK